jgi:hypothetical protein
MNTVDAHRSRETKRKKREKEKKERKNERKDRHGSTTTITSIDVKSEGEKEC